MTSGTPDGAAGATQGASPGSAQSEKAAEPLAGREKLLVLLCVSIPSFMINLDSNVVAVSLPTIARSLRADFADLEWVISAYVLTFAALLLPAGTLADRYGRKRTLIVGLAIFTIASFFCGAAVDATTLNVARAVQGVGAALQLSAALAILSHSFQGPDRARAFSFWGSVVGIAITLGPIAGGVITQIFGWQWAFYINLPVGVVLIILTAKFVRESADPHSRGIDFAGVASFSLFLFLLTLALISGNRLGWTDRMIVIELIAAAAAFLVFLIVEARHARPMLDLSFFRHRTYIGASVVSLAFSMSFLTMVTYVPMYFQGGFAATPIEAGLLMLPMAVPVFVVPRLISTPLARRASDRVLLATGLALVASGLFGMALVAIDMNYPAMLIAMFVSGCGAGIVNGEVARVSMTVIPPARAGMASGIGGTVRFSGIVIGFAVLAAILFQGIAATIAGAAATLPSLDAAQLAHQIAAGNLQGQPGSTLLHLSRSAFADGYQALFLAAGIFAASAAALAWWLIRTNEVTPVSALRSGPESDATGANS